MNRSFFPLLISLYFLVATTLFSHVSDAQAEFFKYRDSAGNLIITNKLENVPQKYRKNVKVIWDEELTAKDPHARRMAAADARYEEQQRQQPQQQEQQQKKQGAAGKLQPSDGKTLVITFDEETGQLIRTME